MTRFLPVRAVTTTGAGDEDVLRWSEVADPVAGPGEVVIEVVASAVNRADLLQRQGFYPPPPGTTDVLGLECSEKATFRSWFTLTVCARSTSVSGTFCSEPSCEMQ